MKTTHKSSSSFDVAVIDESFSIGGGADEEADLDPPICDIAIPIVPKIVPSALKVDQSSDFYTNLSDPIPSYPVHSDPPILPCIMN